MKGKDSRIQISIAIVFHFIDIGTFLGMIWQKKEKATFQIDFEVS